MENSPPPPKSGTDDWSEGLRLGAAPNPEELAAETARLRELNSRPFLSRLGGYLALGGPGYLQSAMTLGGGTAASALFAGAVFGYELLWVAPVAMLIGVIMLAAVSWQTLSTGARPYRAMARGVATPVAATWAIGALFASIVWHFPQYSLASAGLADLVDMARGIDSTKGDVGTTKWPLAFPLLAVAIITSFLYSRSRRALRLYETILRFAVWGIVLCFTSVVLLQLDRIEWGALFRGFFTFQIPGTHTAADGSQIHGWEIAVSGLSAAVGVNMLFLYPYTLLARGWGRDHRQLSFVDLIFGMLIPYTIATSMMVIATATTMHAEAYEVGKSLSPLQAARALESIGGMGFARVALDVGFVGMALSSITLHMVCAGFACCELFGWQLGSKKHWIATLLPAPGVLGPLLWGDMAVYLAVPANIICLLFLPIAYIGFTVLQTRKSYLGEDRPRGFLGKLWLVAMIVISIGMLAFCIWYVAKNAGGWWDRLPG